jgi:transcriptional regulator with XRE-family HTH domain
MANDWVREQREKLSWTRPQLAERCGLTVAKLAGIELGRAFKPGEEEALKLALKIEVARRVDDRGLLVKSAEELGLDPLRFTAEANPEYEAQLEQVEEEVKLGRMVKGKRQVKARPSNFKRTFEWTDETGYGLTKGDPVRVRSDTYNEPGKENYLRGAYVFICHVVNTENDREWIEVVGGKPGHRLTRDFTMDRIEAIKPKRRRSA